MLARADVAHELGAWFTSCREIVVGDGHRIKKTTIQTATFKKQHLVSAETLELYSRCNEVLRLPRGNVVEKRKKLWYILALKSEIPVTICKRIFPKLVTQSSRCVKQRYNRMSGYSWT